MPRRFKAAASSGLSTHLIGGQRRLRHSEKRQRHAIQGFAKRGGFEIIAEFYDAAVSGADPIESRAGFAALLDRIEGNGVRTEHLPIGPIQTGGLGRSSLLKHALFLQALRPNCLGSFPYGV